MRNWVCLALAVCLLASFWGASMARNTPERLRELEEADRSPVVKQTAVESEFFNDLHVGAFWFPAVRNKGYVGYYDLSAYYPGGGDQSNVWQAGMWAGGYVDDGGGFGNNAWRWHGSDGRHADPNKYDTLDEQAIVETETDLGQPYPFRRLTVHVNTDTKPLEPPDADPVDAVDGDMGMDVTFEYNQWGVRGYDNWVFIHVTVEFSKDIEDFYWGWMSDCDVGDVNVPDFYFDDFAGWDEDMEFCYMRDWDGDPLPGQPQATTTEDSLFLSPNAVGQVLLAAPPVGGPITAAPSPDQRWVSKNYWDWNNDVSGVQDQYNRLAGIWENTFPPETDFDYRIVNGVGPYDVEAGDIAEFWMGYVIGEGYDDDSQATFGLGTLVDHVADAHDFYDGGMVIPTDEYPPRAPNLDPDLDVDVTADELTVHWDGYANITGGVTADSFIVYTSTISKVGPWTRVAAFTSATTTTVLTLAPGFYTYVWVEAYDNDNGGSNQWTLSSRLWERDGSGILRANENTIVNVIGNTAGEDELDDITVAPNPYIGSNPGELEEYETLIGFHHLPEKCDIYVYTLLGNVVNVIHHDAQSGSEYWDMTTRTGEAISSGLYVYRVKSDDGKEKIGKFAVIKGQR
jgi:hypothetical protein